MWHFSIILLLLFGNVNSYFIEPSVYENAPTNKLVCQSYRVDENSKPITESSEAYLECINGGTLKVLKAELVLSTRDKCPLQFTGRMEGNEESFCKAPHRLINNEATEIVKQLCDTKSKCVFSWIEMPKLKCTGGEVKYGYDYKPEMAYKIGRYKRSAERTTNLKAKLYKNNFDDTYLDDDEYYIDNDKEYREEAYHIDYSDDDYDDDEKYAEYYFNDDEEYREDYMDSIREKSYDYYDEYYGDYREESYDNDDDYKDSNKYELKKNEKITSLKMKAYRNETDKELGSKKHDKKHSSKNASGNVKLPAAEHYKKMHRLHSSKHKSNKKDSSKHSYKSDHHSGHKSKSNKLSYEKHKQKLHDKNKHEIQSKDASDNRHHSKHVYENVHENTDNSKELSYKTSYGNDNYKANHYHYNHHKTNPYHKNEYKTSYSHNDDYNHNYKSSQLYKDTAKAYYPKGYAYSNRYEDKNTYAHKRSHYYDEKKGKYSRIEDLMASTRDDKIDFNNDEIVTVISMRQIAKHDQALDVTYTCSVGATRALPTFSQNTGSRPGILSTNTLTSNRGIGGGGGSGTGRRQG